MISFNASTWNQIWAIDYISLPNNSSKYAKIVCPIILSSTIIAILIEVPEIKSYWTRAGYLSREINTGLFLGGDFTAKLNKSEIVYLNKAQVFTFHPKVTEYSLVFDSIYAQNIMLRAWEYIGE